VAIEDVRTPRLADKIEVYRDGQGFIWRRLDPSGQVVRTSPGPFVTPEDARRDGKRSNPDAIAMLLVGEGR
jgi:hypothetical protein